MRILLFITVLFLFISCDESFNADEPFSFDKSGSKVATSCKSDTDCTTNGDICDINAGKCKKSNCIVENINCGEHGVCKVYNQPSDIGSDKYLKAFCECDETYKTYFDATGNDVLECKATCGTDNICLQGNSSVACVSSDLGITCSCGYNYFQDENNNCVTPCNENSCVENRECITVSISEFTCKCENGSFDDGSGNCVDPCEGEICSGHGICVVSDTGVASCSCHEVDKYYQDEADKLKCVSSCDGNETCGGNGVCIPLNRVDATCTCDAGYQDRNTDLNCVVGCDYTDICGVNSSSCTDIEGDVVCNCKEGYFQDENYQCVSPCKENSCGVNTKCMATSVSLFNCNTCDSGYFKDGSDNCVSPCIGKETCGGFGVCTASSLTQATCTCDSNYQDNDTDLICEKSCTYSGVCSGNTIADCSDSTGKVDCHCDNANNFYQKDSTLECLNPCEGFSCGSNEECIASDAFNKTCECSDNYFRDINDNICKSPCENHELCNECENDTSCDGSSEKFGNCIASSLTEASCTCINGATPDPNSDLICRSPAYNACDGVNCGPFGGCVSADDPTTTDITEEAYCNCAIGYQDNDRNMVCAPECDASDCGEHGTCNDTEGDFKFCECDTGYQDANFDLMCNVSCDNPTFNCNAHGTCQWLDGTDNGRVLGVIECMCPQGYSQNSQKTGCLWNGYAWTRVIGGEGNDHVESITSDSNGNIYISGYFYGIVDFDPTEGIDYHQSNGDGDIFLTKLNADGSYAWTKTIGGVNNEYQSLIKIDKYDNIYLAFIFKGEVDFNPGKEVDNLISKSTGSLGLIKFNKSASYLWGHAVGRPNNNSINYISIDNTGSIYIVHSNNRILRKLSSNGIVLWEKTYAISDILSIITDSNDNLYLTGYFSGIVDFDYSLENTDIHQSNGSGDVFIKKLNSNGGYVWTKTFGGIGVDIPHSIKIDSEDNIYITGSFYYTVDFNPEDDNNPNTESDVDNYTAIGSDGFITKFSSNGNYEWTRITASKANFIVIDNTDYIYMTSAENNINKYSKNGDFIWRKESNIGHSNILVDNNYNIYTIGNFRNTADFDPSEEVDNYESNGEYDVFIWKYSQNEPTCLNVNCNNHGTCQTDENSNSYCVCDIGYQDNEPDLYCEPSCDNPNINNCGLHGICDDSSGNVVCLCDVGYALDGNYQCDECDYGFHKENGNCISDGLYKWTQTIGALNYQILHMKVDSNESIYLIGSFKDTIDFDLSEGIDEHTSNGDWDFFITKLNSDGSYVWTKTVGGVNTDNSNNIAIDDNDNIYLTGYFKGTVDFNPSEGIDEHIANDYNSGGNSFVMKLSNEGEYLWTKTFECNGIGSSNSSNITVLNNEIIIIGSFKGTVDFNFENGIDEYTETGPTGGSNGFITKLSTDGSYLWTRISKNVYGSNNSLTTDNLGDTYIAGYFEGTINFNSNENIDEHTSNGNEDIFITKINGNGSYIWTKTIGGGSSDRAYSIITDNSGNLYFTGSFFETVDFDPSEGIDEHTSIGGADIFITKLSSDGEYKYTKIMGSKRYDGSGVGASLSFDSNNIYITGDFYETVDFNSSEGIDEHVSIGESDVFITKLSSDGEYKYTKIIGGKYSDSGQVVDVKNNNVYILGKYADAVDFDPSERVDEIIAIQGLNNSFLWKWSQDEVPTCTIITCPENEHCILENNNSGCVCDDNFHLNGNYQCIAD